MTVRLMSELKVGDLTLKIFDLVHLGPEERLRNLHCFDSSGKLLWRIQAWQPPADVADADDDYAIWVGAALTPEGGVRVFNQRPFSVALSLQDGSISDLQFSR